jgi:alpha-pyrone synthase
MAPVCIHRIATSTPPHDVHAAFIEYAYSMLRDSRARSVLSHMVQRSGIDHRYSYIQAGGETVMGSLDGECLFRAGNFPTTAKRMELFKEFAPPLLRCTLDGLSLDADERSGIRHVIVTCCTGLFAPGLDFSAIFSGMVVRPA